MSLKQSIESRVEMLKSAVQQSVGNHHALLGRLAEAEELLKAAVSAVTEVEDHKEEETTNDTSNLGDHS